METLTNPYCTEEQLREQLGDGGATQPQSNLIRAINATSRAIDLWTGRRFYADADPVARILNPRGRVVHTDDGDLLLVPDISTAVGLIVETGSSTGGWTAVASYETYPDDALYDGWPITGLLAAAGRWAPRVRITAPWGFPSTPAGITQAAIIRSAAIFKRKESIDGTAGFGEMGIVRISNRLDPDVIDLLTPFKVMGVG